MQSQNDFKVHSAFGGSCEYGWDDDTSEMLHEPSPLESLRAKPSRKMEPRSTIEGWIRFVLKDIDPDKVDYNSWQFVIVDSEGSEYPITKTAQIEKKGR